MNLNSKEFGYWVNGGSQDSVTRVWPYRYRLRWPADPPLFLYDLHHSSVLGFALPGVFLQLPAPLDELQQLLEHR